MKHIKLIGLAQATLIVSLLSGSCAKHQGTAQQVKVGYLPISTSLPVMLAEDRGFFDDAGLDVQLERFANSNLLLTALQTGQLQATAVCADEPILGAAAANESPGFQIYLQEVLDAERPFDSILVGTGSGITSIAELEGKTLAAFPGSQLQIYSRMILEHYGVDPDQVDIVQLPPPNMIPSLAAGTVDAIFALEPIPTLVVENGVGSVLVNSPIVHAIHGGKKMTAASFLISTDFIEADPEAAEAFVQAVQKAVELIEADYKDASSLYPDFTPIPAELAPKVVITRFQGPGDYDVAGLRREIEVLEANDVLEGEVNVEALFYGGTQ